MGKQGTAVHIRGPLYEAAQAEAKELGFATAPEVINARLANSFKKDDAPVATDIMGNERQKSYRLQNAIREMELAQLQGRLTDRDVFLVPVKESFAQVRQFVEQAWQQLPDATPEQRQWMRDQVEIIFASIRGDKKKHIDHVADEAATTLRREKGWSEMTHLEKFGPMPGHPLQSGAKPDDCT